MKKLFLLAAICAPLALFTQCKESAPANEFTLDATVTGEPVRAYLVYVKEGENIIDSVDVVNNKFQFKGTAEEPFTAFLALTHDPEAFYSPRSMNDVKQLYIEPGVITITSDNQIHNATITGSAINADAEKYAQLTKEVDEEISANISWFYGLDPKEREENIQMASETNETLMQKKKAIAETFINENPDSWFALYAIFYDVVSNDDSEQIQALLDKFTPRLKETQAGQKIQSRIEALKSTSIGAVAPDFTQNDAEGNPVTLSGLRGQWVLVDFWASWCGPCRQENPHVVAAFNQYKDKNFTVLGVSLDDNKDNWLKAIEDDKLAWTQVADLNGWKNEAAALYAVTSIPSNFLINPEGVIVEKNLRGEALSGALAKHIGE